jgi:uncharacterized membrane protein
MLARHWLALVNGAMALFLGLPFVAPLLLMLGYAGAAEVIYAAYQLTCHEWAFRSFFLFGPQATYSAVELQAMGGSIFEFRGSPELGYKVAFCVRNVGIYAAVLAAGLAYCRGRGRLKGLDLRTYLALIAPMALDGLTQLVGWRESSWELRLATGGLLGLASVWLLYPRCDQLSEAWLESRSPLPLASSARI